MDQNRLEIFMKEHPILPLDQESMKKSKERWNAIAKPLFSLGKLEEVVIQMAGIFKEEKIQLDKKTLVVICADNGVVSEGISQTGQEVTKIVAENFLTGQTTAAIMCKQTGASLLPIDMGIASDTKLKNYKLGYGTKNMAIEPAMSKEEAIEGILRGISIVRERKEEGYRMIATGEMGIGNTTTSSAVASVLLGLPVEEVTGKGAGLSKLGVEKKIAVIKKALSLHQPTKEDPIDLLAKVGGYDLAGLTGIFLGGGIYRIPIVIDGMISSVAALLAASISEESKSYMIASHLSKEPAGKKVLDHLGKSPFLMCDMCLGEGTGAVSLFPILDLALAAYHGMSTFKETSIEAYKPLD